ncbi:protocadherin Fat 4-like [Lytechinus variegatus]|uniref:protocadherin Fat 4-like n=1 Tax=Lytechinus variegatus TaxID=7654 RepID=UPI001BB25179|nr:protocadherin Fat 4-like [Lytechinus variegatus]
MPVSDAAVSRMCGAPRVRGKMCCDERTMCRGSQSPNLFEMMSRSKRKRWTNMMPGALVLYLTLLCMFPGGAKAQNRATTNDINLFVDENQPPGTYVGSVAEDGATSNSYSFLSSPPNDFEFQLNSSTGIITTTVRIDRELLSNDLFILPVAVATSAATNIVDVKITVSDLNDNSPVFPQPVISLSFSENADSGSVQILPSAMDADKDSNGYISTYRIESVSGEGDDVFSLQTFRPREDAEYTVSLVTNSLLDRETEDFYILNISATDNSSTPRTGYLIVNVTITDVNDNSPIFTQTTYVATVNESSAAGTSVVHLNATDIDEGSNGEIVYRLKNEQSDNFALDPDTGWITLLRQLPYTSNGYLFEVTATDKGSPSQSSSAFVKVMVEDENDNSPVIMVLTQDIEASGVHQVSETIMPGPLFTLRAMDDDRDDNGRVSLNIYSGNERNDFSGSSIPLPTGDVVFILRVSQTANIDREITASYNLTFVAQDMGTPTQTTYRSIIIYVVDENDHAPEFLQGSYHALLSESLQIGSFVESVTATDADVGINADIVYSITGDEYGWFQIDNKTGLVTTKEELDHETAAQVILTITASDQGLEPMTNTTTLTIDILDENDEYPVFNQSIYSETVRENSPGRDLVQVLATDLDNGVNGEVTYTISSDQYSDIFSLDSESGLLQITASLDREEQDLYELEIIASDGGVPPLQATATVNIAVLDQNDNPPQFYPTEYYASIRENEPAGLFVTIVSATDLDVGVNGAITFSLSNSSKFQIDSRSGNVTTLESLDREQESSYTLTVHAQDGGGESATQPATIYVSVTDTLDNPLEFELNPYRFQLEENRPNSTEVGTVLATSMDLNVEITYAIVNGDPNGLFVIDFYSGVIKTRRSINREAFESTTFRLTVLAVDGSQNGQTVVEIEILDINDNAPVFALQEDQVDVVENWAIGYEFYAVQVTDADSPPNNLILYDISMNFDNRFGINHTSGVLFLSKDLQSYPEKEYNLQIQATDYGTPPLSSSMNLLVSVRDVNNNAPVFADSINTTLRLTESIPVNRIVIHALATDADEGTNGEITYSIASGNTADSFGIFPNGMVYVKRALDREQVDQYDLAIEATDGGVPSMTSTLMLEIIVLDENDNRPFFDNATYNFYLSEEAGVNAFVGTIHAVDNDVGKNGELTYSFTANHSLFTLNPMSGAITCKVSLDRESLVESGQPTTFSIRVRVRDGGQSPLQDHADVNIHIVDINDSPPAFNRESYQASVSELAQNQTLIIRVSATDDDVGDNANILYSIIGGNEERHFHIDHVHGQIILIAPLDREVTDNYVLRVKARDGGTVPQESFVDVEITVLDENDHRPSFDSNVQREIEVTECLQIGDIIGSVRATDMDINSNGRVSYTITGGNLDGVFGVNSNSGEVYLTGFLDHEATSQYLLNITARDGGSPSLQAVLSLVINIRDCNDNSPIFAYVGVPEIDEEEAEGFQVVRVSASDSDSGVNGEVRFSILSQRPARDFFAIDPESGWITTSSRIDRESEVIATDQFILTVHATDLAVPVESRRTATVDVVIFVRDINDNAPRFTSQQAAVISRSTSTNTKVATLHADDPDTGVNGQVTYTLLSTGVPFRLDLNSGDLTLTQTIPSSVNLYSLDIQAQDAGSNPQQQMTTFTLTIIISDGQSSVLNYVQSSYSGSVRENQPSGTEIVNVVAQYSDGRSATVRYYVSGVTAGGVNKGNLIVASPTNGIIRTGDVLDREDLGGGSSLVATVYAVDTSSSSSHVKSVQVRN